jgi:sulfhydrogenase subunit alpha
MKTIDVPALARVEGEGGLYIQVREGEAPIIRLDIYEPPRFFEGFLVGRYFQEVPDITARICGICPVAYQMSSISALESALGIEASREVYQLRKLMYCGEYIESHALHIFMLQAPDLLGQPSAIELAGIVPEVVKDALRLKKIGNQLLKAIGGRSIHPVNACVGGFHRWPDVNSINDLVTDLQWGLEKAYSLVKWSLDLAYPKIENDYEFVAVHNSVEYGVMSGEILSSRGFSIPVSDFETHYIEEHVRHSNALHGHTADGGSYMVGPLARINLNHEQLSPRAKLALKENQIVLPIRNPYKSLIARMIELVHYYEEALELAGSYHPTGQSSARIQVKSGEGSVVSEAPRGLLYHRYKIDEKGLVKFAKITPPTAQNLPRIEADLAKLVPELERMSQDQASLTAEHLVRSYDPCISCATHFLKLRIYREN